MHRHNCLHQIAIDAGQTPAPQQRQAADSLCTELRDLFCNDVDCFKYQLEVRVHGSVCNDTDLPSSDADIAVIPTGVRNPLDPEVWSRPQGRV